MMPGMAGGDIGRALGLGVFAFAWLYGMNMLLATFRVPGFFQRAVNGAMQP